MSLSLLSVLIVTYNNSATIEDCINSVINTNDIGDGLEIIVVDNGSIDDTCDKLQKYVEQRIVKLVNSSNNGFGAGNNLAVAHSRGEYLFFLNPDTVLVEPIFLLIKKRLQNDPNEVGGFHLIDKTGKSMPSFGVMPEKIHIHNINRFYYYCLKFITIRIKSRYPWGASLYLTKNNFIKAGEFDESFFLNFEEADLVHRLNIPFVVINKEKIIHLESISKPKGEQSLIYYFESESKYFSKYFTEAAYFKYKRKCVIKIKIKKTFLRLLGKKLNSFDLYKMKEYEK